MAKVDVTKELLETLGKDLNADAQTLLDCSQDIEELFPENKGFTILQAPPVNDAFPAVSEFAGQVLAEIKARRYAKRFGPSSKIVRREQRLGEKEPDATPKTKRKKKAPVKDTSE